MAAHNFNGDSHDMAGLAYFDHSTAKRVNTDIVLVEALRTQYPNLDLVIAPQQGGLNLLAYASAGFAKVTPLEDTVNDPVYGLGVKWRSYIPPARRLDTRPGAMVERLVFGKFLYKWKDQEFIVYIADGRDGAQPYPSVTNHYILTKMEHKVDALIKEATTWSAQLHNEVWVFDGGYWQKSAELYASVQNASWDSVILNEGMKKSLIADVENFFDGQDTYQKLKVPWKRGIIYYGPPGNGKTISIKAMMHSLYQRGVDGDSRLAVPTLYVRTLSSFAGPEFAIKQIFAKARQEAPCYLVFEDLDSIVSDSVRSYFLNEVDGLRSNDGILMVGSTNHLDRLDPGISKRPSRFDRKYYFPNPSYDERAQYAKFWQGKLEENNDLDFPDKLCAKIAEITDKFSFAYMQEAFVASLLAIAARGGQDINDAERESERWAGPLDPMTHINQDAFVVRVDNEGREPDIEKLELWIEIQKQVKILRDEMEEKSVPKALDWFGNPVKDTSRSVTTFRDELDAVLHGRSEKK
ncbi:P-loop containing nucleoside triphosphate hydrolase protein [Cucurbitaria berberidis CBS 394.84]|uniref:P-loop containing nucleoside triphosphate hydrolase protein n=1 Tax=Cucurbitaria berberidis CBS 394.84 TaxID=1168544 RepID=A0A9P4L4S5_9PLEO|nr:P-loop containing nucleoside triphosphate hydrolase protein [Cucurbitaria berberidis CBS 394.84]KAF1842241.1 P-loop containing nucleoside triphosphate hydrolase protein [Cucurbitaria berberidis CBS 394.84]